MNRNIHVRCGTGEKLEIVSNIYLSLLSCVLWRGVAESTVNYCKKGDLVGIKGHIQTTNVEKDDTIKQYVEVVAEKVTFLSGKKADN